MKKFIAEVLGTFILVFIGVGSVVAGGLGGALPLGQVGIALSFGLAVTAAAYAIGPVSGAHLNPAVTLGAFLAGRMPASDVVPYMIAQVIGATLGAFVIYVVAMGKGQGFDIAVAGLGQNGWDPVAGFSMTSAFVAEVVTTFLFVTVILGVTDAKHATPLAGLVIGLTLTIIHIDFIPVTGVSVNPARSIGPALFVGGTALSQLWLFIAAPLIGGALAGILSRTGLLSKD